MNKANAVVSRPAVGVDFSVLRDRIVEVVARQSAMLERVSAEVDECWCDINLADRSADLDLFLIFGVGGMGL